MKKIPLLILAALLSLTSISRAINDEQQERPALKEQIQGKWILSGTPEKIGPAPKAGGRIKTIKGNTWEIVQKDPETGRVIFRHGGTFTLVGDKYIETVKFANENTKHLVGNVATFKLNLNKDDILINHGQGNPWNEAWRRVKK